jgi:hypothetical protein
MDPSTIVSSPQLVAANQWLHALRAQAQAARQAADLPDASPDAGKSGQVAETLPWVTAVHQPASTTEVLAAIPAHLGWGSAALTAVLRRREQPVTGSSQGAAFLVGSEVVEGANGRC